MNLMLFIKGPLVSLGLIYLALCLILFLLQRQFLYFPRPSTLVQGTEPISFSVNNEKLSGWLVNKGQSKALIYYGGNAEQIEHNTDFFRTHLADYSVFLIPYRGYGENSGSPTEQGLYEDALFVFDKLVGEYNGITLMGRSLGTGVATYVATQRKVEKLVLITPYDSIVNVAKETYWMFPVSWLLKDKFLSAERAAQINSPTLVLIAEHDRVISRNRSEQLKRRIKASLLSTQVITNAGHNDISDFQQYSRSIKDFLGQ